MADGFAYYPCCSTSAVLYSNNANRTNLNLFNLRPQHQHLRHHCDTINIFSIPRPFTILSSSIGFILCRDRFNSYHVFNPISYYHLLLPTPPRPHNATTPAVISFDWDAAFYVVCAVEESQGRYTFDVFHSYVNEWTLAGGPIDLNEGQGKILSNTGISCYRRAFWLTEGPRHPVVVRHDPDHPEAFQTSIVEDGIPVARVEPWMRLQLGRIKDHLGLVLVDGVVAELFLHDSSSRRWVCMGRTSVENVGGEYVTSLQPLRFESGKLEVMFSAVGRRRRSLVLWESDDFPFRTMRVVVLPGSENASAAADGAIPYVIGPDTYPRMLHGGYPYQNLHHH